MSRPYPNRRRKRPARRPPNRYRGGGPPVRPDGFQDLGLRHVYDLILPGSSGGHPRRRFFNRAAAGLVVGMGLTVAFIGLGEVGLGGRDPRWSRGERLGGPGIEEAPVLSMS